MTGDRPKQTILAVDDTPENLDVVKGILAPQYTVKAAINGKLALKIAEAQTPDLILLDIMMPEMDGYEVCRQLKSNPKTSEVPVIFLTAKDQTMDEAKGFGLGAADYILKPVNPPILEARVKTHLALKQNMDALQKAYGIIKHQKERMQTELNIGHEIQMSMLPLEFPAFPERKEFSVYATLEPAREVGGDFYDFFFTDDDQFCVCIGDVSGKGVPSALFMAVAKTLIKSRATDDSSTASILTYVNTELSTDNKSCMFVTIFLGILNIRTGQLIYTNAGHNPPYLKRKNGAVQRLDFRHGPVIGAMDGIVYEEDTDTLGPGDLLFMYTDGVTEEMDADGNLFSEERLVAVLESVTVDSTEVSVRDTVSVVKSFKGETEQSDDITVLALQFQGNPASKSVMAFHMRIKNDLSEIANVNAKFEKFAKKHRLSAAMGQKMGVVFDELLSNVISYAFAGNEEHEIEIKAELAGNRLTVTLCDDGVPFNPLGRQAPDTSLSLEEREVGGLGIHLVRNMVDDISYQRRINRNILSLVIHVDREGGKS